MSVPSGSLYTPYLRVLRWYTTLPKVFVGFRTQDRGKSETGSRVYRWVLLRPLPMLSWETKSLLDRLTTCIRPGKRTSVYNLPVDLPTNLITYSFPTESLDDLIRCTWCVVLKNSEKSISKLRRCTYSRVTAAQVDVPRLFGGVVPNLFILETKRVPITTSVHLSIPFHLDNFV